MMTDRSYRNIRKRVGDELRYGPGGILEGRGFCRRTPPILPKRKSRMIQGRVRLATLRRATHGRNQSDNRKKYYELVLEALIRNEHSPGTNLPVRDFLEGWSLSSTTVKFRRFRVKRNDVAVIRNWSWAAN